MSDFHLPESLNWMFLNNDHNVSAMDFEMSFHLFSLCLSPVFHTVYNCSLSIKINMQTSLSAIDLWTSAGEFK